MMTKKKIFTGEHLCYNCECVLKESDTESIELDNNNYDYYKGIFWRICNKCAMFERLNG
jgi:hypothetical protein